MDVISDSMVVKATSTKTNPEGAVATPLTCWKLLMIYKIIILTTNGDGVVSIMVMVILYVMLCCGSSRLVTIDYFSV